MTERQEHDVDALLAALAARQDEPDADFVARMQATALAMQPMAAVAGPRPGRSGLFDLIGGWLGAGGLATAAAAGLWLGIAPPEALTPVLGGAVTVDLLPGAVDLDGEG